MLHLPLPTLVDCLFACLFACVVETKSVREYKSSISCLPALEQISYNTVCYIMPANISIVCLHHAMLTSPLYIRLGPLLLRTCFLVCVIACVLANKS